MSHKSKIFKEKFVAGFEIRLSMYGKIEKIEKNLFEPVSYFFVN